MPIPISAAFKAHLAKPYQTLATIIRLQRTDGMVFGFTDHDRDIVYDDGSGSVTYLAAVGYQPRDAQNSGDMTIGNSEYDGILNSPSITEADLKAGLWDYAALRISYVNYADLTMRALRLPGWKLGKVTVKRNMFTAEIRDIMQAYSATIGELTQPGCRANLGDARCKVNLAGQDQSGHNLTVTGTLTGVSADQMTLYDTARTEPGPAGGVVIASISKSSPGHVTLASGGGANFSNGEAVTISGCVAGDFTTLNANTIIRNLSGDTFDLGVSTASFVGTYTGNSGTLTPLGGGSGFFDFGFITMTSGAASGFKADVLSYLPSQWTLQLPFPYPVAIGDTYTMVAGCDKSLSTCVGRFANGPNMRAEPYLPGIDKIVQVGKQ